MGGSGSKSEIRSGDQRPGGHNRYDGYGRSGSSSGGGGGGSYGFDQGSGSLQRPGYRGGGGGGASGSPSAYRPSGGAGYSDNRPISIDRTSPDDYQKILRPKKTEKRIEFNPNIPKTLTPKGYAKLKLMMNMANKQYQMLTSKLTREGRLWEDEDFPANDNSIKVAKLQGQIEWKRPKEIDPKAEYFVDGPSRFDIEQGELGDCWLLAVLSSISSYPSLYDHVLPKEQRIQSSNYCGVFRARFWRFGQWVEVLIDDRLPVRRGTNQLVFMHSDDHNEFWSALIEKAYAKLCGCYNHLSGGTQAEAMEDLTGGVCETILMSPDKRTPDLPKMLMKFSKHCCLMGCCIDSQIIEQRLAQGLIAGHAYSVTGVANVTYRGNQQMLVRARNPWGGKYEWTGPWSDNSSEWSYVSQQDKQRIHLEFRADGEFWMSYEDFVSKFVRLEVCHLGLDSLEEGDQVRGKFRLDETVHTGLWEKKISAGGCVNYRATFWKNPQIRITLVDPDPDDEDDLCTVFIGLMQKDMRKEGRDYLTMGFMIYAIDATQTGTMSRAQLMTKQPCAKSSFTNSREVSSHFRLKPGNYVIIPSTFEPNQEGHFIIRVLTSVKIEDQELDNDNTNTGIPETVMEGVRSEDLILNESADMAERFKEIQNPQTKAINATGLQTLLNESSLQDLPNFKGFDRELCRSLVASVDVVFFMHDKEMTGYFNDDEFRDALQEIGYTVSYKMFNNLVHRYQDPDTSNISFGDFMLCAIRMRNAFETVEAHPKNNRGTILFNNEDVSNR